MGGKMNNKQVAQKHCLIKLPNYCIGAPKASRRQLQEMGGNGITDHLEITWESNERRSLSSVAILGNEAFPVKKELSC